MSLIIEELHKKNKRVIKSLIAKNKYNPYTNLRFFKDIDKLNNYYYELFFNDKKIKILSARCNSEIVGLLTLWISDWDSRVFQMKMAKIGYNTARGSYAEELTIKKKLLVKSLEYAKEIGIKHLSTRVECNDFSSIHALESYGFKIMDNLATYILNRKTVLPGIERWFTVKEITKDDLKSVGDLIGKRIVLGHYSIDPAIPSLKVKNMYREWLESKFSDLKNNDIFVAKRKDKIIGCSLFSFNSLLRKYTGLKTLHRGLIVVEPSAVGCFYAFINATIKKRGDLDFAEFETQTYNYKMMNILQKLGMQLIRCRYTFHRIL